MSLILYIEPFSGISGDMMLGALIDLGADFQRLELELRRLQLDGYKLALRKCLRSGIEAKKLDVEVYPPAHAPHNHGHDHNHGTEGHTHRSFRHIHEMIQSSGLSEWVKEKSIDAFRRLAEAEGRIHAVAPEDVHFHEVGALDSIVDIVGCMIALEQLMPVRIVSSSVNVGRGTVVCRHGIYPVPAPAAQELLTGIPTYSNFVEGELTTPTGAALLAALVQQFGPRPLMKTRRSGYGAGTRDTAGNANVLRLTLGEEVAEEEAGSPDVQVSVIEATIDDMNPQVFGYFLEKALSAGALDVYLTSIQMKKNRPGVKLTAVCPLAMVDTLTRLIFLETTTIGIRYSTAQRKVLQREFRQVQTEYGTVTMKVAYLDGRRMNYLPEYEDCRRLAIEKGVALKEVIAAAVRAYLQNNDPKGENS